MKIIVGLGNPGDEYRGTRHNAGFSVLDKIAKDKEITPVGESLKFREEKKFKALIAETSANGERVILAKPQTFMNLSGQTVTRILQFYKVGVENLIVVSDDVDLPLGHIRVRHGGSSGGHKGLQNIIDILGSDQFARIRLGVSSDGEVASKIETKDFVLSKFSDREKAVISKVTDRVSEEIVNTIGSNEPLTATTIEIV